jgi:hypothetical protein
MKITIGKPERAVIGWNVDVSVEADKGEKIGYVEVRINDFRKVEDSPDPAVDSWEQQLVQVGDYPEDNKAEVLIRDQDGNETRAERKWS